ncbi:MAG TPA: hypothetical protein VKU02_30145 [Gemmataceae bacterium]|nr:hypothetical protein [Gemmataceae bacterium]
MSDEADRRHPEPLPDDLQTCHELILRLREELAEVRRRLEEHEAARRREFERMYGKGVTPQSLLDFGLLMAGKGGVTACGDQPTCGERACPFFGEPVYNECF